MTGRIGVDANDFEQCWFCPDERHVLCGCVVVPSFTHVFDGTKFDFIIDLFVSGERSSLLLSEDSLKESLDVVVFARFLAESDTRGRSLPL